MIQLYVVTDKEKTASAVASSLVKEGFAVAVRVDFNQHFFFRNSEGEVDDRVVHVVMGLTKALLFNDCVSHIHQHFNKDISIFSIPITQANETLSDIVRNSTRKV